MIDHAPLTVSQAVARRVSVRAFTREPVPGALVKEILEAAARAPSGGNLQPWRVYALAGDALAAFKSAIAANPEGETPEYDVYPPNLWEPFRTRRFSNGEDLYRSINVPREDRVGRLEQFGKNATFFGAPVGMLFCLDRRLGPPQWADLGMYMQTVMLLAAERGLYTCPQEYWARYPRTVAQYLNLPDELMLFAGMALGWRDPDAPINRLRTSRDPFDSWAEMRGF